MTKKLTLTPAGPAEKASEKALRAIEKSAEYSYLLRINKRDMVDFQSYCKMTGVSAQQVIREFVHGELVKAGMRNNKSK